MRPLDEAPCKRVLRLSHQVYTGSSIVALGVAAHEAGGREVLNAAALTYVAATAVAALQLIRLLIFRGGRD
ncbi:MAG: zinc metallopeptidase [Candidatus Eisenbacteria bacterium]